MQYQYQNQQRVQQQPKSKKGSNIIGKVISTFIKKVLLSPFIVFIIAFFYFNQDVRKALLVSLYFYTGLTVLSIFLKILGLFTSAVTFNLVKFLKRSIDLVVMLVMLVVYWLLYSLYSGANFTL